MERLKLCSKVSQDFSVQLELIGQLVGIWFCYKVKTTPPVEHKVIHARLECQQEPMLD